MSLTAVLLDNREPSSILSLNFGGVPKSITQLEYGDCWATTDDGEMLIIERKTPSDLLSSIKDGRLFQQVAAMRQRGKWIYLCITGVLMHTLDGHIITDNRTTGWKFDDAQGALLTVQELGVSVVVCQSDQHYEAAILRLAQRDRKAVKAIEPRVEPHVLTDQEKVLIALPGIGVERAGLLLGEHGSAAYSIAWLTWLDSFAEVSGIGNGTKHNVRRALGLKPEEWLTVMDSERSNYAARELVTSGQERTPVLGMQR